MNIMITEILAFILAVEFIVIDSWTTLIGLKLFGGVTEQNPLFSIFFEMIGGDSLMVILLTISEGIIIIILYSLASSGNRFAFVSMLFFSLAGLAICVDDAILLYKCLL